MIGTLLDKYEVTPQDGITYDCVGLYGGICTSGTPNGAPVAKWRHKLDTTWSTPWSGFDVSLGWRYYGKAERDLEDSARPSRSWTGDRRLPDGLDAGFTQLDRPVGVRLLHGEIHRAVRC